MWYVFVNYRGHAVLHHFETENGLHDWMESAGYTERVESKVWINPRGIAGTDRRKCFILIDKFDVWSDAHRLVDRINLTVLDR